MTGAREKIAIMLLVTAGLSVVVLALMIPKDNTIAIRVEGLYDTEGLGVATQIRVNVINISDEEFKSIFSVVYGEFPYYWKVLKGPDILKPGENATYTLYADRLEKAIHEGPTYVIIRANNAGEKTFSVSEPILREIVNRSLILNKELKYWVVEERTGLYKPHFWGIRTSALPGTSLALEKANINGKIAVGLQVKNSVKPPLLPSIELYQEIPYVSQLNVVVYPTKSYELKFERYLAGIKIQDGRYKLIVLLSDKEQYVKDVNPYFRLIVAKTPLYNWSVVSIDVDRHYEELGWIKPKYFTISLFLATDKTGEFVTYFGGVDFRS